MKWVMLAWLLTGCANECITDAECEGLTPPEVVVDCYDTVTEQFIPCN